MVVRDEHLLPKRQIFARLDRPFEEQPGLVTVVIPCYNLGRFLAEAVESVRSQTYKDVEIIVVDDGSIDDTADIATGLGVALVRQHNQGVASARNAGLASSRGEFVMFLDADDRLSPAALSTAVDILRGDGELAFVCGLAGLMAADGSLLGLEHHSPSIGNEDMHAELLRECFIWCPATVLIRKRVLAVTGAFDPGLDRCQDFDLYLRITRGWKARHVSETFAAYRQRPDGASRSWRKALSSYMRILRRHRPGVSDDESRRAAYREGIRRASEYYGTELITETRTALSHWRWREVSANLATLLRYHRAGLLHALVRTVSSNQLR